MNFESIVLLIQQSPYGALITGAVFFLLLIVIKKFLDRFSALRRPTLKQSQDYEVLTTPKKSEKNETLLDRKQPQTSSKTAQALTLEPKTKKELDETQPLDETSSSLEQALGKTRDSFWGRIKSVFSGKDVLSDSELEQIEEVLYTSDLGPQTVQLLMDEVQGLAKKQKVSGADSVRDLLKSQMLQIFARVETQKSEGEELFLERVPFKKPLSVWMMVGVNGAGKTTTIGKLATLLAEDGKKVLLAAGDTFRAAAGEQLRVWTERAQVEIFSPADVKDPSAVAFDAVQKAQAQGFDVVIIDTAGRLHTQKNLMEELKKMKRVIQKILPEAPHETLLVLDANQGQNALIQAREYHAALDISGVVLTKLDGTAKGGVALGVAHDLGLSIRLIGVGEKPRDLRPFVADEYVNSLLGMN